MEGLIAKVLTISSFNDTVSIHLLSSEMVANILPFYPHNSYHHKPLIFPPKPKFVPKSLSLKQSFSVKTHEKVSLLSPIKHSDIEVVQYSLSLLTVFFAEKDFLYDCKQFHGQFVKMGVVNLDEFIQNKLVGLYSRREEYLDDARKMFDEMSERDVCVYASLIGSYCRCERWVELLEVVGLMVGDGILPDRYLVPSVLKACVGMKLLRIGKMVHGFGIKNEMLGDVFVGNSLIDFYSNCGDLRYSRNVFDAMQEKDVVSWTALVSAYMDHGCVDEAMDIFYSMEDNGVDPDLISWNALVSGLARNGEIDLALQYWEEVKNRGLDFDVSSWNGFISGCVRSGFFKIAFDLFYEMMRSFERPNAVTIVSVLTACAGLKIVNLGRVIHGYALKSKCLWNIHVEGSLVDMYTKCGMNDCADKVFSQAENKNTALWNAMVAGHFNEGKVEAGLELVKLMIDTGSKPDEITYNTILFGYAKNGNKNEAYEVLSEMTKMGLTPNIVSYNILISGFQQYGLSREALNLFRKVHSPNEVTITGALAACADLSSLHQGKEIHAYVIKCSFESNIFVSNTLVDMYAKCGEIRSATEVFWKTECKNTISWNSLIAGCIKDGHPKQSFKLFNEMLLEGLIPSSITFMILLPTCGDMKLLSVGRSLHGYIFKLRLDIELNDILVGALVDMYDKCGCFEDAKLVGD